MAIARIWRGATRRSARDRYLTYLEKTGFAEYGSTEGSLGVLGLRRDVGERTEFLLVSLWDSMDAVRLFAGADPRRAVFYPEDDRFLIDADREVAHWEVCFLGPPPGLEQEGASGSADRGGQRPVLARLAEIARAIFGAVGRSAPDPWPHDDRRARGWRIVGFR